jgi:preprotein translocase subunit YajC
MSIYVLAQSSDTAAGGGLSSIFLLVLAVGVFFLITLPQRRMRKQQAAMQSTLEVGDSVRTIGGIRGTILSIDDDSATIQVEDGKLIVERRAIAGKIES